MTEKKVKQAKKQHWNTSKYCLSYLTGSEIRSEVSRACDDQRFGVELDLKAGTKNTKTNAYAFILFNIGHINGV